MKKLLVFMVFLLSVLFLTRHCSADREPHKAALFVTPISDVLENPQEYTDKVISIKGTVSGSSGLFNYSLYTLSDDTGNITVLSDKAAPENGQVIRVEGSAVLVFRFGNTLACYFKANQ